MDMLTQTLIQNKEKSLIDLSKPIQDLLEANKSWFSRLRILIAGAGKAHLARWRFRDLLVKVFGKKRGKLNIEVTAENYEVVRYIYDKSLSFSLEVVKIQEALVKYQKKPNYAKPSLFEQVFVEATQKYFDYVISSMDEIKLGLQGLDSVDHPNLPDGVRAISEQDLWDERNKAYGFVV